MLGTEHSEVVCDLVSWLLMVTSSISSQTEGMAVQGGTCRLLTRYTSGLSRQGVATSGCADILDCSRWVRQDS